MIKIVAQCIYDSSVLWWFFLSLWMTASLPETHDPPACTKDEGSPDLSITTNWASQILIEKSMLLLWWSSKLLLSQWNSVSIYGLEINLCGCKCGQKNAHPFICVLQMMNMLSWWWCNRSSFATSSMAQLPNTFVCGCHHNKKVMLAWFRLQHHHVVHQTLRHDTLLAGHYRKPHSPHKSFWFLQCR